MTSYEAIRTWVREAVGQALSVAPVDVNPSIRFREFGLDSAQITGIVARLSDLVGLPLPPTTPWEHPTPEALARHVAELASREQLPPPDATTTAARRGATSPALAEPIAVVGMGCRLPGGVRSPEQLWALLLERRHGIREVPAERWAIEAFLDGDPAAPGKMTTRWGGFIDEVDRFDAPFFGISPREAQQMDPQQRLALELAWEAIEDAGIDPLSLRGRAVGVFVGAMWSDYARLTHGDPRAIDQHTATGQDTSIISARVSYALGLEGASLTVNTACSSSMMAIHLACQSLRLGETTMALAGGVHLMVSPHSTVAMTKFGAMNPDGQCRAFDASANGYVRGEGGGVVLLKPLGRAIADGDRIYCVIRGSAANNDGFSNGLTAPNPKAQEAMLRRALENAGVDSGSIHYVETHGPGTILGDPMEAGALGAVLGVGRPADRPLRIGSVKTNLGHLEAAAGVTGLMKAALALHHRTLPPSLNFERPNPYIPFEALRLEVQTRLEGWPFPGEPPRAGVSSFGFGGTNCHAVLEAAPGSQTLVLPLAAEHPKALRQRALAALDCASQARSHNDAAALCRTAAERWSRGALRAAIVGRSPEALVKGLSALLSGDIRALSPVQERPRLVFVCPGHGPQWLGMARALLVEEPSFRAALEACDRSVKARCGFSVIDELLAGEGRSRLHDADVVQLALFGVQVALAALWRAWGITPDALVGHSMGEATAAHLAGVLSLEDAVQVIAERSRLAHAVAGQGGMLAVSLPEGTLPEQIMEDAEGLVLAAFNGPRSIVLSGALGAVTRAEERLSRRGARSQRVKIEYASHSPQMDPLLDPLREALRGIAPREAAVPVRSTVVEAWLRGPECGPEHWAQNLRSPVRFRQAIEHLAGEGPAVFVELSPHPVLIKAVEQTVKAARATASALPSCWQHEDERGSLRESLAALFRLGFEPRWGAALRDDRGPPVLQPELAAALSEAFDEERAGEPDPGEAGAPLPVLALLSAKTEAALRAQAARLRAHLLDHPELALADVALSLATARSHFERRAAVIGQDRGAILEGLDALGQGRPHPRAALGTAGDAGKVALLFTGQGSQRAGMGRALYDAFAAFRDAFDAAAACLDRHLERPLREVIFAPEGSGDAALLDQTAFTQPALFALEVALFRLLHSWGLAPDLVMGHSIGEIAAAHVAGVFSLEDAATLVAARGRLMQALPRRGAMVSLQATEDEVRALCAGREADVDIAAQNGPLSTVIAGDDGALVEVVRRAEALGRKATRLAVSHAFHSPLMEGMQEAFRRVARELTYHPPRIPVVSTVSGKRADADELRSPEYWVRHARCPVRFLDGMRALAAEGATTFVELGPHGVLCAMGHGCLPEAAQARAAFVPVLRSDRPDAESLLAALGALHARGHALDWRAIFAPLGARRVPLPTYAFQRERYWLDAARSSAADHGAPAGRYSLSGARRDLPDGSCLHTVEVGPSVQQAIAAHLVYGRIIVPGAFHLSALLAVAESHWPEQAVELRDVQFLRALSFERPTDSATLQIHLTPTAGDERSLSAVIATRTGDAWTSHVKATVRALAPGELSPRAAIKPPAAAPAAAPLAHFDEIQRATHIEWGPSWWWLREAIHADGRRGFGRFEAPEGVPTGDAPLPGGLIDNALGFERWGAPERRVDGEIPWLPFAVERLVWYGRHGTPPWAEQVVREEQGDVRVSDLVFWDAGGLPLAHIEGFATRRAPAERFLPEPKVRDLYEVAWVEPPAPAPAPGAGAFALLGGDDAGLPSALSGTGASVERYADLEALHGALDRGGRAPGIVAVSFLASAGDPAAGAHDAARRALALLQAWLASARLASSRLVVITRGAVAAGPDEGVPDLACAPVWGLLRAAQVEHPERALALVDIDEHEASLRLLPLALASGEAQLAVRAGRLLSPRLARASTPSHAAQSPISAEGTILITGGTGALGALLARHLVKRHGARHLLLLSRQGPDAPGAEALVRGLSEDGATVALVACDAADRDALRRALAAIPEDRPLQGVVHTAGVLDDGVLDALTGERLDRVLRPKVDAALHLHELTRDRELSVFVLFSSIIGLLGNGGQASYAAANAFLDALASQRRAEGRAGLSLAFGPWAEGGMAARLSDAASARLRRQGMAPLSPEEGLGLFDACLGRRSATLVPARLDMAGLRGNADEVPLLFRGLVRAAPRGAASSGAGALSAWKERLAPLPEPERERVLLEVVRAEVAAVLGAASSAIAPSRPLQELGVDSLMAVELKNRLGAATGLRLPTTLLFDHPTLAALVRLLREEIGGGEGSLTPAPVAPALARGSSHEDPIAIVGMGLRYPGDVRTPEALWQLLLEGRDAITPFPTNRGWDVGALYDADPDRSGTSITREGGFLHDADQFDGAFFGISPREAQVIDPQQRLLLEIAWEALERAEITPASLHGSPTGVFVGVMYQDYGGRLTQAKDAQDGHVWVGSAGSVASGRIAYTLGLEGPTVTVDTACSSSLVAVHLACQALRNGECSLALAGGVAVMATPNTFIEFSRMRGLAPDGRCKAFSAEANGVGWGEGAGLLVLERLSDARKNGHPVIALVRASAINQDGRSQGLTAPNGPAQQRVIRSAIEGAGLSPADIDAVEAHGTGTTLGDPIEAQALLAAYGRSRPPDRPLWLGSIKSNIGHTQAAAGAAGIMKMVLAMQHELLPRTLHAERPSPHLDWSSGAVRLLQEPVPWRANGRPRRAGVSSFGISGTNAHVILEEAPAADAPAAGEAAELPPAALPSVISGRTEAALRAQAAALSAHVQAHPEDPLADIARALAGARTHFERRAAIVAPDRAALIEALDSIATGRPTPHAALGEARIQGKLVFVFPGQGGQWAGMARPLLETSEVFRAQIDACERALAPHLDWSLGAVLRGEEGAPSLERVDVVQPALFAVMVSLAALWRSLGVVPDAVVGHSQGEIAAACAAGALSLEDAARVVALRSRALRRLAGRGAMAAVELPAAELPARLARWGERLAIAAHNGPRSAVVSGEPEAIDELLGELSAAQIFARKVRVDVASHSAQMDAIRGELGRLFAGVAPRPSEIPLYSTVSAEKLGGSELDAAYWARNLRETVRFREATDLLLADGHRFFVEISPHPVLATALQGTLEAAAIDGAVVGSLRRDEGGLANALLALGELFAHGYPVDLGRVLPSGRRAPLPTYAFQRARAWLDAPSSRPAEAAQSASTAAEGGFWEAVEEGDVARLADALHVGDAGQRTSLEALLPALSSFHRARREQDVIDGWRYRVVWKPLTARPGAGASQVDLAGPWLLFLPAALAEDALVRELARALGERGAQLTAIPLGDGDADRARLGERLQRALEGAPPPRGVLALLALDEAPLRGEPVLPRGLALTLTLVQALGDAALRAPLWLLTRGAVSIGRSDRLERPMQAAAWGLGRVVALEHPERWGGLIDLPATLDEAGWARLASALAGRGAEDELALRASGLFARRLVRAPLGDARPLRPWAPRGTALVTGGTGGLGAHVARWLAERGAEHLVVTSRRGRGAPGAAELEAELSALGARVTIAACDAGDRGALEALLQRIDAEGPPLRAVIHAAGIDRQAPIAETTLAELAEVVSGKVTGAQHLHELLGERPLDAFALFSSVSGVWGSGQRGAYAAANAFLDALAEHRAAQGKPATSIAWGLWAGAGMASDAAVQGQIRRRGLALMDPRIATAGLHQAVESDERPIAIAAMDWSVFAPSFAAARARPLLDDLPEARRALETRSGEPASDAEGSALLDRLKGLPAAERLRHIEALVLAETAAVLGHSNAADIDADAGFFALGLDSLLSVALRRRLQQATGMDLPSTLAFDHPSPRRVAALLRERLAPALGQASPAVEGEGAREVRRSPREEPIAIIGVGLRLPGGIVDLDALFGRLAEGLDAVGPIPADRFDVEAVYDPDPDKNGKSYARGGAFLDRIDLFDAGFFGVSPREARQIDPQHRLLLEAAWEALEGAGVLPASRKDSQTGVFIGIGPSDYERRQSDAEDAEAYAILGTHGSFAAGRVAFTLGLQGPALSVNTACSSSLVALHLACQALRRGECDLALAGGVQVIAAPDNFVLLSRLRALSPDGRSKSFSADADGFGRGEGVVVLALERLSDARARGHSVLSVIRGTAVNHDGASSGITAPNGTSQQKVLRAALEDAHLSPAEVDVVECHGTGTSLGDPIEVHALAAVYGEGRSADRPLLIGAIKTNVAHLESASGLAGVAKIIASLRAGALPPTLHASRLNPNVDWDNLPVRVVDALTPWPPRAAQTPRRAGVSSFGLSGTNAHVILEEAPPADEDAGAAARGAPPQALPFLVFLVSGKVEAGLRAQAAALKAHLLRCPDAALVDVAHSLATTRTHFDRRAAVIARDRDDLLGALDALAEDRPAPRRLIAGARSRGKLALLFPGQGSQRPGMGRALYGAFPAFRDALDAALAHLDPALDRPLREAMFAPEGAPDAALLDQTAFTQPALFALSVALFRLLESWGVAPDLLLGHSIGEIAAAHVAGVLSLEDACALVAARGRLMQALPAGGAMVSLRASEDEVRRLLRGREGQVDVAAVNGPLSTVIAGDEGAVLEVAGQIGRKATRLAVSHAFHSPRMEGMLEAFGRVAGKLAFHPPRLALVSSVTGRLAAAEELASPAYWVRHARQAVRFSDGMRTLEEEGTTTFLELGPHGALSAMGQGCLSDELAARAALLPALRRDDPEVESLLAALGALHARGHAIDWERFFAPLGARRVPLPTYAFQRERFWIEAPRKEAAASAAASIDALRYRVAWRPLPGEPTGGAGGRGALLVIVPAALAGDALVQGTLRAIGALGAAAVLVPIEGGDDRARIEERLRRALEGGVAPRGVVSLLGLDASPLPDQPALRRGLTLTLALMQALGAAAIAAPLWIWTRGAVSIGRGDRIAQPLQAMLWGLGRVLGLEHPDRWGGLLDLPALPAELDDQALSRAVSVCLRGDGEDQLALRASGPFARRLVRAPRSEARPAAPWRPRGAALITGGTGALGAHVARWLAREGAEHLVLASRRGLEAPGAAALAAELEALGARVTVAACDAADREALARLIHDLDAEGIPLSAVFHAAGVERQAPIAATDVAALVAIASGKAAGAQHLDDLLGDRPLDAFVLFSSGAAVWGGAAQGAYAAANAYLDALAEARRDLGKKATSIAWGPWAGGGMADDDAQAQFRRRGLFAMAPERAIAALQRALDDDETTLTVADFDWSLFAPAFAAARVRPLLDELLEARRALDPAPEAASSAPPESELLGRLRGLGEGERLRHLASLVLAETAAILGHADASRLDARAGFFAMGFDSLMSVELRKRLQQASGVRLPATLTFDHPSPHEVAARLSLSLREELGERAPNGHGGAPSDEEVKRLLGRIPIHKLRAGGLLDALLALAEHGENGGGDTGASLPELEALEDDALLAVAGTLLEGS
ncbi:SDR family NAD(P)-dependent oxidoreductase [Sorangium sp. So ce134]